MVTLPIPAAARYCARGQPKPPHPTTRTDTLLIATWPVEKRRFFMKRKEKKKRKGLHYKG